MSPENAGEKDDPLDFFTVTVSRCSCGDPVCPHVITARIKSPKGDQRITLRLHPVQAIAFGAAVEVAGWHALELDEKAQAAKASGAPDEPRTSAGVGRWN